MSTASIVSAISNNSAAQKKSVAFNPDFLQPVVVGSQVLSTVRSAGAGPSIALTKAYPTYEFAGSITKKNLIGSVASETVSLKSGVNYSLSASFGLIDSKKSATIQIKDSQGNIVKTITPGVGKTSSSNNSFKPLKDDTYTIAFTGIYSGYSVNVTQALSTLPSTSGDANIDALVQGATNSWQHAVGSSATTSSNVIHDNVKSLNNVVQNSNTVYYDFLSSSAGLTGNDAKGFKPMDSTTQAATQTAFAYLSSLININFVKADATHAADIEFGENNQGGLSAGYANPPNQSANHAQYLFLANDQVTNDSSKNNAFAPGTYGWETLIHEIGHTLGLKHPFNGNAGGGGAPPPYLPAATNNRRYSIMSYSNPTDASVVTPVITKSASKVSFSASQNVLNPQTYMTYDIEALQYLYGANKATSSDDAALSNIQTLTFEQNYKGFETLWTPWGGTLDASATLQKDVIDLRGGAYSSINYISTSTQSSSLSTQLTTAGFGKTQAAAMVASSGINAAYTGLNVVGLAYGAKLTTVKTGAANDVIYAADYSASIDGGGGSNTVYLQGTSKDWSISTDKTKASKGSTVISLKNIQAISFYAANSALTHTA